MSQAAPFRRRTVLILIAVGLLAMLGFLLTATYGDRFETQRGNTPGPTSRYATGFQALYQLVERSGGTPSLRRSPEQDESDALLVLLPNIRTQPAELTAALQGHDGASLIVLPKWITQPQELRPTREDRIAPLPAEPIQRMLRELVPVAPHHEKAGTRLRYAPDYQLKPFETPDPIQAVESDRLIPLIAAPDGATVLARIGGTDTYLLADPDLLNNLGLAKRRNAHAAIALLAALGPDTSGTIAFDTMLPYGAGGRNIGQLMFEPPFAGVTVALLAAALLAGIATFNRFGPPRREPRALAMGKSALIENIVGLARRAGRTREGGPAYADAIRAAAARRLALPRTLQREALDTHLEALPTATSYTAAITALRQATTETDLLHAAQQLDDWRKEVKA